MKYNIAVFFVVDYRSFEGLQGEFSIPNVSADLDIAIAYLKKKYNSKKFILLDILSDVVLY